MQICVFSALFVGGHSGPLHLAAPELIHFKASRFVSKVKMFYVTREMPFYDQKKVVTLRGSGSCLCCKHS